MLLPGGTRTRTGTGARSHRRNRDVYGDVNQHRLSHPDLQPNSYRNAHGIGDPEPDPDGIGNGVCPAQCY